MVQKNGWELTISTSIKGFGSHQLVLSHQDVTARPAEPIEYFQGQFAHCQRLRLLPDSQQDHS